MDGIEHLLSALFSAILRFSAGMVFAIRIVEDFLRARLTDLGITDGLQTGIIVVPTLLIMLVILKVSTPLLRLIWVIFLLIVSLQWFDVRGVGPT